MQVNTQHISEGGDSGKQYIDEHHSHRQNQDAEKSDFGKRSNDDLIGLPSQLWAKEHEDITYKDKAIWAAIRVIIGSSCYLVTDILNETHIENHKNYLNVLDKKERNGKGLLTVCNHSHYVEDPPILVAAQNFNLLKAFKGFFGDYSEYDNWKWTPAEKRNFFYNRNSTLRKIFRWFFGRSKVVPIIRGLGPYQLAQTQIESFLRNGDSAHIFGEGKRTRKYRELGPFRQGVGKLVSEAPDTIVLPFGHDGFEQISPYGCSAEIKDIKTGEVINNMLRTKQRIQIVFGEPMDLSEMAKEKEQNEAGYLEIASVIREKVLECHQEAIELNRIAALK